MRTFLSRDAMHCISHSMIKHKLYWQQKTKTTSSAQLSTCLYWNFSTKNIWDLSGGFERERTRKMPEHKLVYSKKLCKFSSSGRETKNNNPKIFLNSRSVIFCHIFFVNSRMVLRSTWQSEEKGRDKCRRGRNFWKCFSYLVITINKYTLSAEKVNEMFTCWLPAILHRKRRGPRWWSDFHCCPKERLSSWLQQNRKFYIFQTCVSFMIWINHSLPSFSFVVVVDRTIAKKKLNASLQSLNVYGKCRTQKHY